MVKRGPSWFIFHSASRGDEGTGSRVPRHEQVGWLRQKEATLCNARDIMNEEEWKIIFTRIQSPETREKYWRMLSSWCATTNTMRWRKNENLYSHTTHSRPALNNARATYSTQWRQRLENNKILQLHNIERISTLYCPTIVILSSSSHCISVLHNHPRGLLGSWLNATSEWFNMTDVQLSAFLA